MTFKFRVMFYTPDPNALQEYTRLVGFIVYVPIFKRYAPAETCSFFSLPLLFFILFSSSLSFLFSPFVSSCRLFFLFSFFYFFIFLLFLYASYTYPSSPLFPSSYFSPSTSWLPSSSLSFLSSFPFFLVLFLPIFFNVSYSFIADFFICQETNS